MDLIEFHPYRENLVNELHTRHALALPPDVRCSHVCFFSPESAYEDDWNAVNDLCHDLGKPAPEENSRHHIIELDDLTIKWERHTELNSFTYYKPGLTEKPFADPAFKSVPKKVLDHLHGEVLIATHVEVYSEKTAKKLGKELLTSMRELGDVHGGTVSDGLAKIYSPLILNDDKFQQIMVVNGGLHENRLGRLAQRMLEIEQYQTAALLGLSPARHALKRVLKLEQKLLSIVTELSSDTFDSNQAKNLHSRMSRVAAETEKITADNAFRFGASSAYYKLVKRRLSELNEQKIRGCLRLSVFIERRLDPAMQTCSAVEDRLAALSARLMRASNILRTHIDLSLEDQNQNLLISMNKRAHTQIRLQETVESLSVVAVSYYLLSLIKYVLEGVERLPFGLSYDAAVAILAPFIVVGSFITLKKIKKRVINGKD